MSFISRMRPEPVVAVLLLAFAISIPFMGPSKYVLNQLVLFFIWTGIVTQWNLVFGVAGIFSLAQMLVFATGGYSAAMISLYLGWSLWITAPIGAVLAVVASTIVGAATLRLRGVYVALLTLAFAVIMRTMIVTDTDCFFYKGVTCYNFTGGPRGLSRFGDFHFRDWLGFKHAIWGSYYLGLFLLAVGTVFAFVVIRSPLGHVFRALRDNELVAATRGINRVKYQLIVFALSAFFTGLMGGFYAGHFQAMGPTILDLSTMLFLLSMMVVGGLGRPWGPLLGCALMMFVDDALKDFAEWRMVGFGLITILFILFLEKGVAGLVEDVWSWIQRGAPLRLGTLVFSLTGRRQS